MRFQMIDDTYVNKAFPKNVDLRVRLRPDRRQ